MNDANQKLSKDGLANLAIAPDLLARELAAQLAGDPLDEIELDKTDEDLVNTSKECDLALKWLQSGNEEKLQGLRMEALLDPYVHKRLSDLEVFLHFLIQAISMLNHILLMN